MKIILIAAACLILLSAGVNAFTISNPNYEISGTISPGGAIGQNDDYPLVSNTGIHKLYVTVGQPFSTGDGNAALKSSRHSLCLGAHCTDMFQAYYSINVSGIIKYDYGDPVANSEARLIVRYGLARYEKKITTGPNGEFSAKVRVPEFIASHKLNPSGFKIQVYAKGRVEAAYTCNYEYKDGSGVCS